MPLAASENILVLTTKLLGTMSVNCLKLVMRTPECRIPIENVVLFFLFFTE